MAPGLGVTDTAEFKPDLGDPCANISMNAARCWARFIASHEMVWRAGRGGIQRRDRRLEDRVFRWEYVFDEPDLGSLPASKGRRTLATSSRT
ncbi:hypothetical protein [Bradyrhizobium yuanmingense]|uniref:hypothetical protein n=1 Tax=Bradyrhizobium yuanmingense TaxID=108015 RepID=UPI00351614E3